MSYKVRLELFEGPLDLLLYLVKKEHLNIYDIPIAKITEQYLAYLELMKLLDLNIAGDFLVMAATLLQIKSKMLLPAEEEVVSLAEEDPRAELVKRLLEYEKYKQIAETLRQKEIAQQQVFKRPKTEQEIIPADKSEIYFEASIFDLINAFSKALDHIPKELFYEVIKDEFTIEEKTRQIMHLLLVQSMVTISDLFHSAKSKIEVIVTFLSVLELIRIKEVIVYQKDMFGEVEISRNKQNIILYEKPDTTEVNKE